MMSGKKTWTMMIIVQMIPQYAKIVLQKKYLEEEAFATKIGYRLKKEIKAKCSTPPK
jgi:hypothetical protein